VIQSTESVKFEVKRKISDGHGDSVITFGVKLRFSDCLKVTYIRRKIKVDAVKIDIKSTCSDGFGESLILDVKLNYSVRVEVKFKYSDG